MLLADDAAQPYMVGWMPTGSSSHASVLFQTLAISLDKHGGLSTFDALGTGGLVSERLCRHFEVASTRPATSWLIALPPTSDVRPQRKVSEMVNSIRLAFGLNVKELAAVLNVERPTIYSWLKDDAEPSASNRERIAVAARLADAWVETSPENTQPPRNYVLQDGRALIQALSSPDLDEQILTNQLINEARRLAHSGPVKNFAAIARRASIPETSAADFDSATGRPLGPEN